MFGHNRSNTSMTDQKKDGNNILQLIHFLLVALFILICFIIYATCLYFTRKFRQRSQPYYQPSAKNKKYSKPKIDRLSNTDRTTTTTTTTLAKNGETTNTSSIKKLAISRKSREITKKTITFLPSKKTLAKTNKVANQNLK